MDELELQFQQRVEESIRESIQLGYNPTWFIEMLDGSDAVTVTRRLVVSPQIQYGFRRLCDLGHPELTVEWMALESEFAPLFTTAQRDAARWRLKQLGQNHP